MTVLFGKNRFQANLRLDRSRSGSRKALITDCAREYLWLALCVLASALLTGCAVTFVGPYDEVTDKAANDLELKTEQYFAGGYRGDFFTDADAAVANLRVRANLYEKNAGEIRELDLLSKQFRDLKALAQKGLLTGDTRKVAHEQISSNFSALLSIELAKKKSNGVTAKGR